ncbi:dephospho-CoA kinase [Oceanithermus sp.]
MHVVGLTGSIGSGKSTVARLLEALGAEVVEADALARQARREREQEICRAFPEACTDGRLDDRALAASVFADPAALRRLEALVHPRVRELIRERVEVARAREGEGLLVVEVPLLFETGWNPGYDGVLVVAAPDGLRVERVRQRSGLDLEAFRQRDQAQLPQSEKIARADWVIWNDTDLDTLKARVRRWYEEVVGETDA